MERHASTIYKSATEERVNIASDNYLGNISQAESEYRNQWNDNRNLLKKNYRSRQSVNITLAEQNSSIETKRMIKNLFLKR